MLAVPLALTGCAGGASPSEADVTPAPSESAGPVAVTLQMTAVDTTFLTKELEVPADQPFAIDFMNDDQLGLMHDIDIRAADGTVLADMPTIDGGTKTTYTYGPLAAGTYTFICSFHPIRTMIGTLTVN